MKHLFIINPRAGKKNSTVQLMEQIERLRQKFLGELRWFTGILDELRLADTLYRKATDKE